MADLPSRCAGCPRAQAAADESLERRGVLQACAAGVALVVLDSACSSPAGARHDGGAGTDAGDDGGDAGDDGGDGGDDGGDDGGEGGCTPTCSTGSKTAVLTFAAHPLLKQVGASLSFGHKGYSDPTCGQNQVIVAQPSAGHYVAFSASCTHACCFVTFQKTEFVCPCHGSTYDLNGQVTGGPAPAALPKLSVCADECAVYVTIP
jgi:Rieske Fe-S protein